MPQPAIKKPSFQSSSDIANYHMNMSDAQAIAELQKMGIKFEPKA